MLSDPDTMIHNNKLDMSSLVREHITTHLDNSSSSSGVMFVSS